MLSHGAQTAVGGEKDSPTVAPGAIDQADGLAVVMLELHQVWRGALEGGMQRSGVQAFAGHRRGVECCPHVPVARSIED